MKYFDEIVCTPSLMIKKMFLVNEQNYLFYGITLEIYENNTAIFTKKILIPSKKS